MENADEITRELKRYSYRTTGPAQIAHPVHPAICDKAIALIESMQSQLAASQRREQAAVADIEKMMRICEKGSCHFCANGDCTEAPLCSPKWRGPQEARKGGRP